MIKVRSNAMAASVPAELVPRPQSERDFRMWMILYGVHLVLQLDVGACWLTPEILDVVASL